MTGTRNGFALALAMLIGALSVTSILALGLQRYASRQQPAAAGFSPRMDEIVDPSGWPREDKARPELLNTPHVERGRSRQAAASGSS